MRHAVDPASFLEDLQIASPCQASWAEMRGDERVRYCGTCEKHVYDLSHMSREEAEALILGTERVCVRMARRHDGTVVTSDCPVGARQKTRRQRVAGAAAGTLLAASALLWKVRAEAPQLERLTADISADRVAKRLAKRPPPPAMGAVEHVRTMGEPVMGDVALPAPR